VKRGRRLRLGLSTLLGFGKRGFFIPYRYADQVPERKDRGPYEALEPIFAEAAETFASLLRSMSGCAEAFRAIGGAPPPEPRWEQDWFPRLDAAALYVLVREAKPARIVEVGSGHSTRFMMRAARDGGFSVALTAIDPAPRADIEGIGATLIRSAVQGAGLSPFAELTEGDILFIDSSHILMPGTDVDMLFNHVLPALKRGVMVHVHDVFLPDDYPPEWEWRGYNEQLGVATLIQGGGYKLLWASHYAATRMPVAIAGSVVRTLPLIDGAKESSLWLVKV
jgi:predicted O-methyltransferase YrrM